MNEMNVAAEVVVSVAAVIAGLVVASRSQLSPLQ